MRSRLAPAVAAVFALAGVASAAPPAPAVVVQTKPVSRLLTDYKEMVRQVGGPAEGDRLVKKFEQQLKDALDEKGFEGLDINRPILAYSVLKETPEDCGLVLVIPVTTEKEFIGFLARIDIKAEPVKDAKGLYVLDLDDGPFPNDSHVRVTDAGWAYITLNDDEPTDPKDFVPVGDLISNDPSLASVKLYPGRVPAKLATGLLDELDKLATQYKGFLGGGGDDAKAAMVILEHGPKLLRKYVEQGLKEATEVALTFNFDPMTGDTATELTVVAKPGTALAKEIAAKPQTANRFAGMLTKDAAGGVLFALPLYDKDLREFMAELMEANLAGLKNEELPKTLITVVEELVKGNARAAKAGKAEQAFVLHGPNAAGKFTLAMGMSFDDPAALEKAVRAVAKDAVLGKGFEFDAAKVGDVSVHKVPLGRLFAEFEDKLAPVFGEKPGGAVAFTKDAIFVGFGPGAVDVVKAALEAKPGPAPVVDVAGNMSKLAKLVAAIDPKAGTEFAKIVGVEDKPFNALRVTVDGGDKLTVRAALNVRYLPKVILMLGSHAEETFKQVNPPGR